MKAPYQWKVLSTPKALVFALLLSTSLFSLVLKWNIYLADARREIINKLFLNDASILDINRGDDLIEERIFNQVNRVRQFCVVNRDELVKTYPDYELHKKPLTQRVWIASPQHQLFYCAVGMGGGDSNSDNSSSRTATPESNLLKDLGISWNKGDREAGTRHIGVDSILEASNKNITEFLDSYYLDNRLMSVRNPWDRLVSVYSNGISTRNLNIQKLCYGWKQHDHLPYTDFTFEKFIDCVLQRPSKVLYRVDTHPFLSLCAMCRMDYNIIVKHEELDQIKAYLTNKLNLKGKTRHYAYKQPKPVRYKNSYSYSDYYLKVPPQHIRQLQKVYKEDIELFDYPPSPFH